MSWYDVLVLAVLVVTAYASFLTGEYFGEKKNMNINEPPVLPWNAGLFRRRAYERRLNDYVRCSNTQGQLKRSDLEYGKLRAEFDNMLLRNEQLETENKSLKVELFEKYQDIRRSLNEPA